MDSLPQPAAAVGSSAVPIPEDFHAAANEEMKMAPRDLPLQGQGLDSRVRMPGGSGNGDVELSTISPAAAVGALAAGATKLEAGGNTGSSPDSAGLVEDGKDEDDEVKGLDEDAAGAGEGDIVVVETQDGHRTTLPRRATRFSGLLEGVFADPEVKGIPVPHLGGLEVRLCAEWLKELNLRHNHVFPAGTVRFAGSGPDTWMSLDWMQEQKFLGMQDLLDRCWFTPVQRSYLRLDMELTFRLLLAAQYLDVKTLVATLAMRIALMLRGQSAPNILKTFGIDEISPEDKAALAADFKFLF